MIYLLERGRRPRRRRSARSSPRPARSRASSCWPGCERRGGLRRGPSTASCASAPAARSPTLRGRRWDVDGDSAALELEAADGLLDSRAYPDALGRIWSLLDAPRRRRDVISAALGYEFVDWGGADHVSGGSHGSLRRGDSLAPLAWSTAGAICAKIVRMGPCEHRSRTWRRSCSSTSASPRTPPDASPDRHPRRRRARGLDPTGARGHARRVYHGLRKPDNWVQLVKFGAVGVTGYVVNLVVFALMVEGVGINYRPAAVIAFCVAVTNNFLWNRSWTFKARDGHAGFQAARFFVVSLIALGFNLLVLELLVSASATWPRSPRRRSRSWPRRRSTSSATSSGASAIVPPSGGAAVARPRATRRAALRRVSARAVGTGGIARRLRRRIEPGRGPGAAGSASRACATSRRPGTASRAPRRSRSPTPTRRSCGR